MTVAAAVKTERQHPPRGVTETRFADISPASYDAKGRTVRAVLSVGSPVKRFFGTEVLQIKPEAVNLDRLSSCGVPLIDSHNIYGVLNGIFGRVERVWFEGGELVGLISFDDSDPGRKAEGLVARGVVRGVSIGYRVDEWEIKDSDGNLVDPERERLMWDEDYTFTAKRWELLEVSLVSVPADAAALIRSNDGLLSDEALLQRATRITKRFGNAEITYDLAPVAAAANRSAAADDVLDCMRTRHAMVMRELTLRESLRRLR